MTPQEIERQLAHFSGTEQYHASSFGWLQVTDGVHAMREWCEAFWLVDAIESHQANQAISREPFQAWTLRTHPDKSAILTGEDGNGKVLVTQAFAFTTFPLATLTIWVENGVALLPTEH